MVRLSFIQAYIFTFIYARYIYMYNSWGNIYFLNPRELRWREKSRYGDSRDERYFWTKKYTIYTITLYKLQTSRYSGRK